MKCPSDFFTAIDEGKFGTIISKKRSIPKVLLISFCIANHDTSRTTKGSKDRLHKVMRKVLTQDPIVFMLVFCLQVNTHEFIILRHSIGSSCFSPCSSRLWSLP